VTIVAVVGDAATTTTMAIAAGWPTGHEMLVLEADQAGGSLAGWLGLPAQPSLATIVANAGTDAGRDQRSVLETVETMARHNDSGIRFIATAVRARAAHRAVQEAAVAVLPTLAASATSVLADVGAHRSGQPPSPALRSAAIVVVAHRQATASAAAATVRIDRLVETVEELAHLDATFVLAVIGRSPFDPAEIGAFLDAEVPDTVHHTVSLADDPLTAATLAGRAGVSAKRLRRLPLMRDAAGLAAELVDLVAADRTRSSSARGFRAGIGSEGDSP